MVSNITHWIGDIWKQQKKTAHWNFYIDSDIGIADL